MWRSRHLNQSEVSEIKFNDPYVLKFIGNKNQIVERLIRTALLRWILNCGDRVSGNILSGTQDESAPSESQFLPKNQVTLSVPQQLSCLFRLLGGLRSTCQKNL